MPDEFQWLYGDEPPRSTRPGSSDPADPGNPGDTGADQTRVLPRDRSTSDRPTPAGTTPPAAGQPTPAPAPKSAPRTRRRFGLKRTLALIAALVVAYVAFLVVVPVMAWNSISQVDASPDGERPADQPGTTYLLVGSDSRSGLSAQDRKRLNTGGDVGQRTDTIMLLHTGSGPNLLMSIPRDSLVKVPGHGTTKINAAFAYGGAPLLVETIEQATGIRIDHYVEIGFGGFVEMVDAVGGITICPAKDMTDEWADLEVKAGCQDADGRLALAYARSRHAQQLGDIDRARHQREVVAAVGAETFSASTVLNPFRYRSVVNAGARSVQVDEDMGMVAFARFADALRKTTGTSGLTCGVPIRDMAVHWDTDRADQLFALIASDRTAEVSGDLCLPSGMKE